MRALNAIVLMVASVPRQRIYDALLADPERDWTVSQLASLLPDVSVEAVRTTVHLLLGDHLMDIVPRTCALTVRLTSGGHATLAEIRASWPTEQAPTTAEEF
ncbi:hypothetical protein [Catellatospora chokoriensis]|uniref:Uncharacterized protein n=1 Tax=Catellatospora chokoriensis TaxID=310353 RepID=A0A8J3K0U8_9ACTN|nr:hypothetical protein [Catellatospora chokoriensis]GIF94626.1 hypothetical protein Cch02nite_80700 [Catellatospora chokoriensis]